MIETVRRVRHAFRAAARAMTLVEGASAHTTIWRDGPTRLLRYGMDERAASATPLLLVTPLINRFRIVDLEPGRSLVEGFMRRGVPVYVVDWGAPRRIDRHRGFAWHVAAIARMAAAVRADRAARAGEAPIAVDLLGYCSGGTLSTVFTALHPSAVRRLATLNAPVAFSDARPHMDLLQRWIEPAHFPIEDLLAAFGNMPAALVQQGFLFAEPARQLAKPAKTWARFDDAAFAESFWALEAWAQDGVDVPGAFYLELIRDLYRADKLARGVFEVGGRAVDLARITCPLCVAHTKGDTTCPPEAARALLALVRTAPEAKAELALTGGHVGAVVGPKSDESLYAPLAAWLRA